MSIIIWHFTPNAVRIADAQSRDRNRRQNLDFPGGLRKLEPGGNLSRMKGAAPALAPFVERPFGVG